MISTAVRFHETDRWIVERLFAHLMRTRRLARDYERRTTSAERWTTACSPSSRPGRARNTIVQHPPPSTRNQ
jgi:hypothetical protein